MEFRNDGFRGQGKATAPREKPFGAKERTNKISSHLWRRRHVGSRATLVGGEWGRHPCAPFSDHYKLNLGNSFRVIDNNH